MDFTSVISGAIVGVGVGIALDWNRQWTAGIFSRREIRAAVGAELQGVLVTLNFFILHALDNPAHQQQVVTGYFDGSARLESFEFYWQDQREKLLKLPEWPRLKQWNDRLGQLGSHQEPLFEAIMLFESLLIPPLDKCLSLSSKQFARNVVARPRCSGTQDGPTVSQKRPLKIDVTDDELAIIIESMEHRYAYSRATQRDDARFQELADKLKASAAVPKKKR